jgi:2,3-bisphosphoglycerate-independent phosphoglycerate mutase
VAAHLHGNWIAYHGSSLLTIVRVLRIGLSVLRVEAARQQSDMAAVAVEERFVEALRQADLLLVHLADTPALVRAIETNENIRFRTIPSLRHHRHPLG